MKDFKVIGLMSGSSLDGVDIAYVNFSHDNKRWFFQIVEAGNIPYTEEWKNKLSEAFNKSEAELKELDIEYGKFLGTVTKKFIKKYEFDPKLIASHGHTIFHAPEKSYTLQIGNGQEIANATGITTINDFRTEDVKKGGQGAPLVPIGDTFVALDSATRVGYKAVDLEHFALDWSEHLGYPLRIYYGNDGYRCQQHTAGCR